jgi:hypothetical protein
MKWNNSEWVTALWRTVWSFIIDNKGKKFFQGICDSVGKFRIVAINSGQIDIDQILVKLWARRLSVELRKDLYLTRMFSKWITMEYNLSTMN